MLLQVILLIHSNTEQTRINSWRERLSGCYNEMGLTHTIVGLASVSFEG